MITKKSLETEINNLAGLSTMVKAYEEIAASRIKKTRDSVLNDRVFMDEINGIFEEVISSYRKQVDEIIKSRSAKNLNEFSFINKNGKTLFLLISANTGLYGNLIKRTFDLFRENLSKEKEKDIAIIGKIGLSMWREAKIKENYYYFDFPDQNVDYVELKSILDFIISYEKIVVFYGQFQNLVKQDPTYSDISGNAYKEKNNPKKVIKYTFEPSLGKILEFFEKQIFTAIFEQTIREAQLAKIASRLTSLDEASENIYKKLTSITTVKNIATHQQQNKKQLETYSSRTLWGKIR